jgi:cob(I)alamin adenosyltransferase
MGARIYTRGGDSGSTAHPGGADRVPKAHPHIEIVGSLDALNSHLGLCLAQLASLTVPALDPVRATLGTTQRFLFDLAAGLFRESPEAAGPADLPEVRALEAAMDAMDRELPPLAGFILPGGRIAAAELHVARTVCRRAERALTAAVPAPVPPAWARAQAYLNRLADYLFVAARFVNHASGEPDVRLRG